MTLYHPQTGHQQAYEKAEVLHRDVSAANIMIDIDSTRDNFKAFLVDWDQCRYLSELKNAATQEGRSVSSC